MRNSKLMDVGDKPYTFGNDTRISVNLLMLAAAAWFGVGQLQEMWKDRKSIDDRFAVERADTDRRIAERRAENDARFAEITATLGKITGTLERMSGDFTERTAALEMKTTNRWTTADQATHCLQMALVNPGFKCVNPWFTVNTADADVSDIPVWTSGNGAAYATPPKSTPPPGNWSRDSPPPPARR